MPDQMDLMEEGGGTKPKRGRRKKAVEPRETEESPADRERDGSSSLSARPGEAAAAEDSTTAQDFGDVAHLTKKGLRVVPVVTGAVVDQAGNFLFYMDGHEDARSGVQTQINHQLDSGPAREEYLAPARARARELLEKLAKPR